MVARPSSWRRSLTLGGGEVARRVVPFLALALPTLLASSALAQGAESSGTTGADPPLPPEPAASAAARSDATYPRPGVAYPPDALIDLRMRRSWSEGDPRLFLATTLDVGWTYLRPRASVGYGKPFSTWVGFDANPIVSGNGVGAYAGLRLALPRFDLRVGPRYMAAFNRNYLDKPNTPSYGYSRLDLDSTVGKPSRVLTLEAEAEASAPAGPGDVIALGSVSYVTGVPTGQVVFEETLRVIVDPPLVWRARVGYVVRFGTARQHSLGLIAELVDVPKRDDSRTVRAGPIVRIVLSRRVEVRGSFVPTVLSPDRLGLVGGDFTELGFRYRWATE